MSAPSGKPITTTTTASAVGTTSGGAATTGAKAEEEALLVDLATTESITIWLGITNDDDKFESSSDDEEEDDESSGGSNKKEEKGDTTQYTMTVTAGAEPGEDCTVLNTIEELVNFLSVDTNHISEVGKLSWKSFTKLHPDYRVRVSTEISLRLTSLKTLEVVCDDKADDEVVASLLTVVGRSCPSNIEVIKLCKLMFDPKKTVKPIELFKKLNKLVIKNGYLRGPEFDDTKRGFTVISKEAIGSLALSICQLPQLRLLILEEPCTEGHPTVELAQLYLAVYNNARMLCASAGKEPKIEIIGYPYRFKDGEYSAMIIPYGPCFERLTKRIEESEKKNKALEEKNKDLESKIRELEAQVEKLNEKSGASCLI